MITGIGHVLNLRFNPSFTTILWDPPLSTAGLMSSLYYQVTVMNIDSGVIFINTTTNSYYTLPDIQLCEYYTANVTVSSSGYHGDGVVFGQVTPGGMSFVTACVHVFVCVCVHACILVRKSYIVYFFLTSLDYYNVEVIKQEVAFNSKSSVKLIITQNLTVCIYSKQFRGTISWEKYTIAYSCKHCMYMNDPEIQCYIIIIIMLNDDNAVDSCGVCLTSSNVYIFLYL